VRKMASEKLRFFDPGCTKIQNDDNLNNHEKLFLALQDLKERNLSFTTRNLIRHAKYMYHIDTSNMNSLTQIALHLIRNDPNLTVSSQNTARKRYTVIMYNNISTTK
jgi:hypothetical protein